MNVKLVKESLEELYGIESVKENLRFSDGMEFDTNGPLHPEKRSDGWYVVGEGMLIPVKSLEEATDIIKERNTYES
jgi:hypothetical protein